MYQKQRTIYTQGFLLIESWREVVQLVTAIIKDYSRVRGRHKPGAVCQGYSTGELGINGQSQDVIRLFFCLRVLLFGTIHYYSEADLFKPFSPMLNIRD